MISLKQTSLPSAVAISIAYCAFSSADSRAADPSFEGKKKSGIEFAAPDGIKLLLDLYLPKGVENPPLVLFIHGGSWSGGSRTGI